MKLNVVMVFWLCLMSIHQVAANESEKLSIGLYRGISDSLPHLMSKVQAAAATKGIEITYTEELPAQRTLIWAASGEIDGDIIRQPYAVEGLGSLIQVDVPLSRFEYWVWVLGSSQCPESESALSSLKPVGMLGIKYFDFAYRLSQVGFEQVNTPMAVAQMIQKGRADYSLGLKSTLQMLSAKSGVKFKACFKRPLISINGYMYLHQKNKRLVPLLEQAFKSIAVE